MIKHLGFEETSILEQLDEYARIFNFPVLDNWHLRIGKIRLTSFLSSNEWLIVFELIAFDVRAYTFENMIYAYGNKINNPGFQTGIDIIEESPNKPFEDSEGRKLIDLSDFSVIINGEERHFLVTEADFVRTGLLPHLQMEPETKLLRLLCFLLPDEFMLTDNEILDLLKRPELEKFLQLNEWSHPDIAGGEMPSQNSCMRNLAKALTDHNQNWYTCPNEKINTHWSNWPISSTDS